MDFLNKYTKKELILLIKSKCFFRDIMESDLMCIRYDLREKELQRISKQSTHKLKSLDGKKADELVERFNTCRHAQVKIKIAEELQKHQKTLDDWRKEEQRISKMRDKHFKYHEEILRKIKKDQ